MKRVYFAGSIRGGREDLALYAALIARLEDPARPVADLRLPAEFLPRELFDSRLPIPPRLSLT